MWLLDTIIEKAAEDAGMRREDFAIEVAKISSY